MKLREVLWRLFKIYIQYGNLPVEVMIEVDVDGYGYQFQNVANDLATDERTVIIMHEKWGRE